jgi:CheY-like chemotaxis protein
MKMMTTDDLCKLTVCIIDDNDIDKMVIIEALKYIGIKKYIYYHDLKAALQYLVVPDLIVSEWQEEKVMQMYSKSILCRVPLIILTYDDQPEVREKAKSIPVQGFISKPVCIETLISEIIKVVTVNKIEII